VLAVLRTVEVTDPGVNDNEVAERVGWVRCCEAHGKRQARPQHDARRFVAERKKRK